MNRLVEDLLSDETVRRKLTDWATIVARTQDREGAVRLCERAAADWKRVVTAVVLRALDKQQEIDESCPF